MHALELVARFETSMPRQRANHDAGFSVWRRCLLTHGCCASPGVSVNKERGCVSGKMALLLFQFGQTRNPFLGAAAKVLKLQPYGIYSLLDDEVKRHQQCFESLA